LPKLQRYPVIEAFASTLPPNEFRRKTRTLSPRKGSHFPKAGFPSTLRLWKCISPPRRKKKLKDLAAQSGRGTDDLVEDAVSGYLEEAQQVREMLDRARYSALPTSPALNKRSSIYMRRVIPLKIAKCRMVHRYSGIGHSGSPDVIHSIESNRFRFT